MVTTVISRSALLIALLLTFPQAGAVAEVCRYGGTTSHAGHVLVEVRATATGATVTVDVRLAFTVETWLFDARYLRQEISTWRDGGWQELSVNSRDRVRGHIVRQQWEVFRRRDTAREAQRVQARTLAAFRRRHRAFAGHWPVATFGSAWLQDYAPADPERRPDLDLTAMPQGLRTPLALAFYWSRWLPPEGGRFPVFLPGFKRDAQAELGFGHAVPGAGWRLWQANVRHAALSATAPSLVQAWVSADHQLLKLAFDAHARAGSASGVLRAQGCSL